ncbi:hypothetical protein LTR37_002189 [Vermiconidia calcicola]|uniref:Uncharacterized protein n=1 Tax=Vermiconidia calcicola TaxID=1690605 RepID=A0ACC3NU68_9PEZI|nr:hypothetical protein LTR37_002189 [Vermiconidia calcicola]
MTKSNSNHNSIEVNLEPGWLEADPNTAPQVVYRCNSQLEKIRELQDDGKIHYPKDNFPIRRSDEEKIPQDATVEVVDLDRDLPPLPDESTRICGLRPSIFRFAVGLAVSVVIAALVGGTVGGMLSRQHQNNTGTSVSTSTNVTHIKSSPILQDSKMTSLYYVDKHNITHYRVYFQNKTGILQESAWNSSTTGWTVTDISDSSVDVQMGTPLACADGYPHAMKNYTMVKNVYYSGTSGVLYERQAPINETGPAAWAENNFSGLYTAASDSSLAAYWVQDFENVNQTLNVMWQQPNAHNGLTLGQYTSDPNNSYPWVFTNLNYSIPAGSTFSLSHYGVENYLRVYSASMQNKVQQSVYYAANHTLTETQVTDFELPPGAPITALTQDNTPLFPTWADRPQCSWFLPPTQLFLFGSADKSTVNAVTWNCSTGFVDITPSLQNVLKPKRDYLALSSHNDGKVYVMFDAGDGPQIEQWTVPQFSGQMWEHVSPVTINHGY